MNQVLGHDAAHADETTRGVETTRITDTTRGVETSRISDTTRVAVVGASGYTGGELLRLLHQHPHAEITAATSGQYAGQPVHRVHPNLRGTDLTFQPRTTELDCDTAFLCMPHGAAAQTAADLLEQGIQVVDLSADHRLDADAYEAWYGQPHPHPDNLHHAVYGLPEATRDALPGARLISGVGCLATAMNLALLPLARAGLLQDARVVVDGKLGSSAAGMDATPASHHASRSRSLRLYAPTSHRHAAEVQRLCGITPDVSVHAVELVRGALATCHVLLDDVPSDRDLWKAYRASTQDEPFVQIVKERQGVHRGPDPKLVAGSNFAQIGFHAAERRIVATAAIDNLVKGASGSAVQAWNVSQGRDETTGLTQLPVGPQ